MQNIKTKKKYFITIPISKLKSIIFTWYFNKLGINFIKIYKKHYY